MPDPSNPAARVAMHRYACNLYGQPAAEPVTESGTVTIILGQLPSGDPLSVTVTDLAWLDALEAAVQGARAAGVVEAGMQLAVRS